MDTTYDVRVWKTEVYKGKRATTYYVRWATAGEPHRKPFATDALADAFRSELKVAQRNGERFDISSGLPLSKLKDASNLSWYSLAVLYVDARWHRSSGHQRANIAEALTTVTMAMLRVDPKNPSARQIRVALRNFAFNTQRRESAPDTAVLVLNWVRRNCHSVSALNDSATLSKVLDSISVKLDGKPAAASSVRRKRIIFGGAVRYAVVKNHLTTNPLKGEGIDDADDAKSAKTHRAIDRRSLINSTQAAGMLAHVYTRRRQGPTLHACLSVLRYAGLRPEEAAGLRVEDLTLPAEGWGEILVHTGASEVGSRWTDSGKTRDERGLKGREAGETRSTPAHPNLVKVLRAYLANPGTEGNPRTPLKPGVRLFSGEFGEPLSAVVLRRALDAARKAVLSEVEYASPLGRRIYDFRHTCLTEWLNSGVPAAKVAAWAGNSVPVLLSIYVNCIVGDEADLKRRIETQLPDLG
jgi:integrase